ncbi:uncharacterized protein LOC113466823 [Diaphorina citri]|uniref:Uncharacterized protein LOC113466823 n=1 Tax=Diaphorina citri TaxID=121845 RepID=A0A3Q0IUI9_DIACI|nr:uncharacterized protein LOC113466823 [Diaphorina citri]
MCRESKSEAEKVHHITTFIVVEFGELSATSVTLETSHENKDLAENGVKDEGEDGEDKKIKDPDSPSATPGEENGVKKAEDPSSSPGKIMATLLSSGCSSYTNPYVFLRVHCNGRYIN